MLRPQRLVKQVLLRRECVAYLLPVDQVGAVEHWQTGEEGVVGGYHIVIVALAADCGVAVRTLQDGVEYFAVSEVGRVE